VYTRERKHIGSIWSRVTCLAIPLAAAQSLECRALEDSQSLRRLTLAEFAYNKDYQASIKMEPYECLYGWKCNYPLCWEVPSECLLVGPDWIQQTHGKEYQI
jgi:hypothetical protein